MTHKKSAGPKYSEYSTVLILWQLQGGPAKVRPTYIIPVTFGCIGKIQ